MRDTTTPSCHRAQVKGGPDIRVAIKLAADDDLVGKQLASILYKDNLSRQSLLLV